MRNECLVPKTLDLELVKKRWFSVQKDHTSHCEIVIHLSHMIITCGTGTGWRNDVDTRRKRLHEKQRRRRVFSSRSCVDNGEVNSPASMVSVMTDATTLGTSSMSVVKLFFLVGKLIGVCSQLTSMSWWAQSVRGLCSAGRPKKRPFCGVPQIFFDSLKYSAEVSGMRAERTSTRPNFDG